MVTPPSMPGTIKFLIRTLAKVPRTIRSERKPSRWDWILGGGFLMGAVFLTCLDDAQAQVTAYAGGSPSNIVLSIPVTASVGGRCGLSAARKRALGGRRQVFVQDAESRRLSGPAAACSFAHQRAAVSHTGHADLFSPAGGCRPAPDRKTGPVDRGRGRSIRVRHCARAGVTQPFNASRLQC